MLSVKNAGDKALAAAAVLALVIVAALIISIHADTVAQERARNASIAQHDAAQVARAQSQCQQLCAAVHDEASAVQFCGHTENATDSILAVQPVIAGNYRACSNKIPCFLLVSNCSGYTPQTCQALLTQKQNIAAYQALITDVGSDNSTAGDGCNLPAGGTSGGGGSAPQNWKTKLGYTVANMPYGS